MMNHTRTIARLGFAALACAPLSVALGEGSELPDGSVTITSLPFFDTGDTSDNVHDYDAVCPWASDAPDVFYALTLQTSPGPCGGAPLPIAFSAVLCESSYDTKVFILDSAFNELACNDDFCTSSGGGGFRSTLNCVGIDPSQTYYIGIDGWSGDSGVYDLIVDGCEVGPPCFFIDKDCPDGSIQENEPCQDGTTPDVVNGGCDAETPLFQAVSCGDTICGEIATTTLTSDFDFFELTTTDASVVRMRFIAESVSQLGRVSEGTCAPGAPECHCIDGTIDLTCVTAPCLELEVTDEVVAGRSWWVVTTGESGAIPCGGEAPGTDYITSFYCDAIPCCESGDATQDGAVTFDDLVVMLSNWGDCAAPPCCALGDANGDGTIGFDDVVIALANWGPCGG